MLTVATGGCSFVFVDGPPAAHAKMPFFDCTSSVVLPTVDLLVGVAAGASAVGELGNASANGSSRETVIIGAAYTALFAASAIYGYSKTSQCREAKAALTDRMLRNPAPAYGPGPAYPGPYQPPPAYDPWLAPPPGAFATPPPAPAAPWGPAPAAPAPTPGATAPTSPPPPAAPSPPPPAKVGP